MQMHPAWRALLQNIELMPQDQDFSFEPLARLEAVVQHADEKKGNCHLRPGSCSDSIRAATQADGVFGTDSLAAAGRPERRGATKNHRSNMPPESAFTYELINKGQGPP